MSFFKEFWKYKCSQCGKDKVTSFKKREERGLCVKCSSNYVHPDQMPLMEE